MAYSVPIPVKITNRAFLLSCTKAVTYTGNFYVNVLSGDNLFCAVLDT